MTLSYKTAGMLMRRRRRQSAPPFMDRRMWDRMLVGDGCWEWTGGTYGGYGVFAVTSAVTVRVHQLVYRIFNGSVPKGTVLDHLCHTADASCPGGPTCRHRRCFNFDHLEPVTILQNTLRGRTHAAATSCPQNHPYDEANTYTGPDGRRHCRACQRERSRLS